jgi:hypothetical protein
VRRALLLGLVAALAFAVVPSAAVAAETCPPYEGMGFPQIKGPEDPEDYCFEVQLNEGQTLEQIDDRHVAVKSKTGGIAWELQAALAHDATGVEVPTTIAVTGEDLVMLTVHHRAGNPAAEGAPFVYPISNGAGWEGGFATVTVTMPVAEESPQPPQAAPSCLVPDLRGLTLKATRKKLRRANCHLGPVHGERSRGAKVVRQYRRTGKTLPAGTEVGVKLA